MFMLSAIDVVFAMPNIDTASVERIMRMGVAIPDWGDRPPSDMPCARVVDAGGYWAVLELRQHDPHRLWVSSLPAPSMPSNVARRRVVTDPSIGLVLRHLLVALPPAARRRAIGR